MEAKEGLESARSMSSESVTTQQEASNSQKAEVDIKVHTFTYVFQF